MYACSTTAYTGFQAVMTEEESEEFNGIPGVIFVLPDSYIDPQNKEYGGDKYMNGTIIPRPPPIQYGRQTGRYRGQPRYDRAKRTDAKPRGESPVQQTGPGVRRPKCQINQEIRRMVRSLDHYKIISCPNRIISNPGAGFLTSKDVAVHLLNIREPTIKANPGITIKEGREIIIPEIRGRTHREIRGTTDRLRTSKAVIGKTMETMDNIKARVVLGGTDQVRKSALEVII